jgi:undecaprenyl-diphosphatase
MIEFANQIDTSLFSYLNSLNNDFFDVIFLWITEKYSWVFLYVIILGLLAWRYMSVRLEICYGHPIRLRYQKSHWPWLMLSVIFVLLAVAMGDQVSVHLFKNVFQRLRPSHVEDLAEFIHLPRRQGGLYGFVSGHATTSFALAYFTSRIIGLRWYTRIIFLWAVIFSYSRIYIGVHYPGDSISGAMLGIFIAWLLLRVWVAIGNQWFPLLLPPGINSTPVIGTHKTDNKYSE